ncbi:MAG: O-succinylhomoserine sulfhydrylase [Acetobacteraceae bacterium]
MTDPTPPLSPATTMVHGGVVRSQFGETAEALYLTSGFVYQSAEQAAATCAGTIDHYQYSRFANPTLTMLETRLALLEGAEACRVAATGMAAVTAGLLAGLRSGDRVVAARALFGGCHWLISTLLPKFGIETEFVAGTDLAAWARALARPARLVLLETPSNPMLEIIDLRAVARMAHDAGALLVVDNVFATPLLQQPLALGADVVVYSATKHIDGQGRVMGGAVLGRQAWIEETLHPFLRNTGAALSPFNAWVLLKGLETLGLRVRAAGETAARIADFLARQPEVARVWYPFRADHPQERLARSQMQGGGTIVSFAVHGGRAAAFKVLNAFRLIAIANNLGDTKSLATHPATTTHLKIGEDERARLGITDAVIRLSVGLEDAADLETDLGQALVAARRERVAA